MAQSETGGVKPFPIAGRMVSERERLLGMTDSERAWRAQYLKDQILTEREPRYVHELYKETVNPIRRFYRAPLDALHKVLTPVLGHHKAYHVRFWTGKFAMMIAATYGIYYYFKYNQNDWTKKGGWRVTQSRVAILPGDPGYPSTSNRRQPADYADRGFSKSQI